VAFVTLPVVYYAEACLSAEQISQALISAGIPPELVIVCIAALPIIELRGAIPFGINVLEMQWYSVFLLAIIGNLLPVPFILFFLEAVVNLLGRISFFKRFFDWLFKRTCARSSVIERYQRIGLTLFVAIPLPVTGAWTGSLAAVILGLGRIRAAVAIIIGVLISGVIVTVLSLLGWAGAIIAGIALFTLAAYGLWKSSRQVDLTKDKC